MEFDITKLILEIKARKPLWQKDNYNHNCREVINKLWIEVANVMGVSKELVKTKWKGLRDNFRSELRKIPKKYHVHRSKWIYFAEMMFLKDQMTTCKPADAFITGDAEDVNIDVDVYTMEDENDVDDDSSNRADKINEQFEYRTVNLNYMSSKALTAYPYDNIFPSKYLNENNINSFKVLPPSDDIMSTTAHLDDRPLLTRDWQPECNSDEDEMNISDVFRHENGKHAIKKRKLNDCSVGNNFIVNPDDDDDFYFLMNLIPTIKTLPPAKKMFLRLKIQQLVYNEVYLNSKVQSICLPE